MNEKLFIIDEYFKRWEDDINKAEELFTTPKYHLEAILVLSCYIGAFAAMRYKAFRLNPLKDGEAFVKVVLEYSGMRTFYEKIDLLFFYQWPTSRLNDNGTYKALEQYTNIVQVLENVYGSKTDIKDETRYISPEEIINNVKSAAIPNLDEKTLCEKLPLFNLAELLYRYVRCDAVHNAECPFINNMADMNGNSPFKCNHAITGDVLLKTTRAVFENLRKECMSQMKFPCMLDKKPCKTA